MPGVLLLLLAAFLLSGCAAAQHAAAPPPRALTGLVHGPLAAPVVDTADHLVYGLSDHGVSVLDEATGRTRILTHLGRKHNPALLAIDPGAERILVEDLRVDQLVGPKGRQAAVVTALADDIDARTGKLLAAIPTSTYTLVAVLPGQGSVAVDKSLHHGFVSDHAGRGVMIDTRSGRLLASFYPGTADSEQTFPEEPRPAAVDERTHRLFIATVEPNRKASDMTVVDTRTGRVLLHLHLGLALSEGLVLDPTSGRIIEQGGDRIAIVDPRSGRLLHAVHAGMLPDMLDIDSRLHRIYVLAWFFDHDFARLLAWIDERSGHVHIGPRQYDNSRYSGGFSGAIDSDAGRLFVVPGEGTIGVFSTATGHMLARLSLGPKANALQSLSGMAVDEGTHRLIFGGSGAALLVDTHAPYTH